VRGSPACAPPEKTSVKVVIPSEATARVLARARNLTLEGEELRDSFYAPARTRGLANRLKRFASPQPRCIPQHPALKFTA